MVQFPVARKCFQHPKAPKPILILRDEGRNKEVANIEIMGGVRIYPRWGGGVDRASSSVALGSEFESHSVYKYVFFTTVPNGFLWQSTPLA